MTMSCSMRQNGDVTILDLSGRLSLGEALAFGPGSDLVLSGAIRELAQKGQKKILLNLSKVTYVDSSGVGQLSGALRMARSQGVELKLLSPTAQVRNLLKLTKLDTLYDIKDDEAAAIEAFSKGAAAGS